MGMKGFLISAGTVMLFFGIMVDGGLILVMTLPLSLELANFPPIPDCRR